MHRLTWLGTPRPYYCAHLAAGVGDCDIVEGIPGKATGMDYSAYRFENGNVARQENRWEQSQAGAIRLTARRPTR